MCDELELFKKLDEVMTRIDEMENRLLKAIEPMPGFYNSHHNHHECTCKGEKK